MNVYIYISMNFMNISTHLSGNLIIIMQKIYEKSFHKRKERRKKNQHNDSNNKI